MTFKIVMTIYTVLFLKKILFQNLYAKRDMVALIDMNISNSLATQNLLSILQKVDQISKQLYIQFKII